MGLQTLFSELFFALQDKISTFFEKLSKFNLFQGYVASLMLFL